MLDIQTISQTKKEVHGYGYMSYAIVRNEKLTRTQVHGKGTHNYRKSKKIRMGFKKIINSPNHNHP